MTTTTGRLQFRPLARRHRLWYVTVRNTVNPATVDLRIRRNQQIVHEQTYELPSIRTDDSFTTEPRFVAGEPHVRFQDATWDTDLAHFALEYRMANQTEWQRESFGDTKLQNIGATIDVGFRENSISGVRVHEFESKVDAQEIIEYVEDERETYSNRS